MKESLEVFGHISVKDLIIYGMALYWLIKLAKKAYDEISEHHDKEQEKETVFSLAKENQSKINSLTEKIDELIRNDRDYKLRSLSDKLFVCYNSAMMQGYITRRQLENFEANLQVYYELGGNGLVKKKYEPEIYNTRLIEDWELVDGKEVIEDETNRN